MFTPQDKNLKFRELEKNELPIQSSSNFTMLSNSTSATILHMDSMLKSKTNIVTPFRLLMIFLFLVTFPTHSVLACIIFMLSVVLGYFPGVNARKNDELAPEAEYFDWIADIYSAIAMFFVWYNL